MLPFEYSPGGRLLIPFRANNSLPPRPLRQRMRRPEALVPAQINATSKCPPPKPAGRSTPFFAAVRLARNDGPSLALHEFRNEATIMSGEEGRGSFAGWG